MVLSLLYTGSALATTAIGTLIPILSDTGELRTRFGTFLLGAGAVGEFGPILLITLILSTESTAHNALILIAFVVLAVGVAIFAIRSSERTVLAGLDDLDTTTAGVGDHRARDRQRPHARLHRGGADRGHRALYARVPGARLATTPRGAGQPDAETAIAAA